MIAPVRPWYLWFALCACGVESCAKVPQATRDALRQGAEAMVAGFASMQDSPAETWTAMTDACRQGTDALAQSAAAMGC